MTAKKMWVGPAPQTCDICDTPLTKVFVDGKTTRGPWGCLCLNCHRLSGCGLGLGKGQQYEKDSEGNWVKTKG